jgi:hypothetical protein
MRILATRVPWSRFILVALLAAAAPAALAFQAHRATERHRAAAERALRDYAVSAALTFREQLISRLYFAVDRIFEPVVYSGAAHPSALRRSAERMRDCDGCGASLRPSYFLRVSLADSSLAMDGASLTPGQRAQLLGRLALLDGPALPPRSYASFVDTLGDAAEVVYLVAPWGEGRRASVVYGFGVPLEQIKDSVLRPILDTVGLIPLAMHAPGRNDSLVSMALVQPGGVRRVELSPRRLPTTYSASIPASRFLGTGPSSSRSTPSGRRSTSWAGCRPRAPSRSR